MLCLNYIKIIYRVSHPISLVLGLIPDNSQSWKVGSSLTIYTKVNIAIIDHTLCIYKGSKTEYRLSVFYICIFLMKLSRTPWYNL